MIWMENGAGYQMSKIITESSHCVKRIEIEQPASLQTLTQ